MPHKRQKRTVTFHNNTQDAISFRCQHKSVTGNSFRLNPGESHEEELIEAQTTEKYWLLDSRGMNTQKCVDTDDLHDCKEVIVTKDGNKYTLTIVPRTSLWGQVLSLLPRFSKGKDETPPTRENGSSSGPHEAASGDAV